MTDEAWDVLVIGAGPAGAVAALLAARQGLRTLLVDAKVFPRRKVCGGCLSHSAVCALRELGIEDVLQELHAPCIKRVRFHAAGKSSELPLSTGYAIDRVAFDAALVRKACEAGVVFSPGCSARVMEAEASFQRVRLTTAQDETIGSARVVVVADGLLRSSLSGNCVHEPPKPRARIGAAAILQEWEALTSAGAIEMTIAQCVIRTGTSQT